MGRRGSLGLMAVGAAAAILVTSQVPLARAIAAPARPTILGARADLALGTLTIDGRGFGSGPAPEVSLGGTRLTVSSSTDDTLVAGLPPGLAPGSLLLVVGQGSRSDTFAATIPATDIVTASGIEIRSTASDVQIVAGSSLITVDPAGGVHIQSNGAIDVDAGGALNLSGNSVHITSAGTLRLSAPSVDIAASGTANISASGTMNVTGSLIRLN